MTLNFSSNMNARLGRVRPIAILLAFLACFCDAHAQFYDPLPATCATGTCDGVFAVGPYKMRFYATQNADGGTTRYFREIQHFGPTQLNLEFAESETQQGDETKDLAISAQLFWGKNELKPPELMETHESHGRAPIRFDHLFSEDGKYILSVRARKPGEEEQRGQYVFFVVQTSESELPVAILMSIFTAGFVYLVWKSRPKRVTPLAPRR